LKQITLVQLNDLHGYMECHQEWFWGPTGFEYRKVGGLARIKTLVEGMRLHGESVLLFDNGDTLHGTAPLVRSEGKIILPVLNQMGFSAMTAHWEFAYGPDVLLERTRELDYPLLAMNVYRKEDGSRPFLPYIVKDIDGTRVAILGIACNIVDKTMPPSYSKGLRFTDGRAELPGIVDEVRAKERPDLVVLLSHLGFPQDCRLLAEVEDVDVCLSSHTHNRLFTPVKVGKTVVIQSGCHGSFLTRLVLTISAGAIEVVEHKLVTVEQSVTPDPETEAMVFDLLEPSREELDEVVGTISPDLNRATMLESTADNFLLQSMLAATDTEIAFSNGWRYGAPIPAGLVTRNDLYNLIPMDPEISLVELKGDEVVAMIEENLERTYSRNPMDQMGGYTKRCLGMKTYFKVENPAGHRVQDMFIQGERIDRKKVYTASFVTMQGVPDRYGANRSGSGIQAVEAMAAHLANRPNASLRNTFSLV
jgi:S-sulfosulfanyl-L-cysteine sulfohydrolase